MHELPVGVTNASSLSGYPRNPYVLERVPGGSSGGTGAAIAASFSAAGMGADIAGSVRIPTANQSLIGLRVSAGLSSRSGMVPLSSTQDMAGPLACCVIDLAIMLDATVGADLEDASTLHAARHIPLSYRNGLCPDAIRGITIGVVSDLFGTEAEDSEVALLIRRILGVFEKHGAGLPEMHLSGLDALMQESNVIRREFKFDFAAYFRGHPRL